MRSGYENDDKLYIPYGLSTEKEYAKGVGRKQLAQIALTTLIFIGAGVVIGIVIGNYAFTIIAGIIGIAIGYSVCGRFGNSPSVLETANNLMRFSKSKRRYRYVYKQFSHGKNKVSGGQRLSGGQSLSGGFIPVYIAEDFGVQGAKPDHYDSGEMP